MSDETTQTYVFFLGRHLDIAACEVWSVLQRQGLNPKYQALVGSAFIVQVERAISDWRWLNYVGGVERAGKVETQQETDVTVQDLLRVLSPTAKKVHFGLSTIGVPSPGRKYLVSLKKAAKEIGVKLNFVEPKGGAPRLTSAQVLFNGLYRDPHAEITLIQNQESIAVVRTTWVQDIQAYEQRDTARPVRDAYVGMLPLKLAQSLLNLAVGALPMKPELSVFDPFCGLGTVLQEGWVGGLKMVGSDKEERMIESSRKNLNWMQELCDLSPTSFPEIFVHDATQPFPSRFQGKIQAIVTEPYLGTPLSKPLPKPEAQKFLDNLIPLYKQFFTNARELLSEEGVLLMLLPSIKLEDNEGWFSVSQIHLDDLAAIGYRQEQLVPQELAAVFPSQERKSLFYARPDAIIGREITRWRKV
jgi:tRNA G10  N-methylase Trm11